MKQQQTNKLTIFPETVSFSLYYEKTTLLLGYYNVQSNNSG